MNKRISLGTILVTRAVDIALDEGTMTRDEVAQLIFRHRDGDWGDLSPEDVATNERAVQNGERVFSSYKFEEGRQVAGDWGQMQDKVWIITDRDRFVTTVLFPNEY